MATCVAGPEFAGILTKLHVRVQALLAQPDNAAIKAKFDRYGGPKFVYDNSRAHENGAKRLHSMCGGNCTWLQRIPSPPVSPDFNKAVEHAHAIVKAVFHALLRHDDLTQSMDYFLRKFEQCAYASINAEAVRRDVQTLPLLWQVVAAPRGQTVTAGIKTYTGVSGAWPPTQLR